MLHDARTEIQFAARRPYAEGARFDRLDRAALTPISFLEKAAALAPERTTASGKIQKFSVRERAKSLP